MSRDVKKYEVTILEETYTLVSDRHEEHVQLAAHTVDEILKEIFQKAPHIEHKKAAVLAALKVAGMLLTCQQDLEKVHIKGQALLDTIDRVLPTQVNV